MVYSRQAMGRRLFSAREMGEGETESAIFYGFGYPGPALLGQAACHMRHLPVEESGPPDGFLSKPVAQTVYCFIQPGFPFLPVRIKLRK